MKELIIKSLNDAYQKLDEIGLDHWNLSWLFSMFYAKLVGLFATYFNAGILHFLIML